MKRLVVLGAGTAGTMLVNRLRSRLAHDEWRITVVDRDDAHHYQPGYLFVPFGRYRPDEIVRSRRSFMPPGVHLVFGEVAEIFRDERVVRLEGGAEIAYDILVVASGAVPCPEETPGTLGSEWRRSIFDFYTLEGAVALRDALRTWDGGRLVVQIAEMPIKCPPAPLEFTLLADAHLRRLGVRSATEITYVTPLDGAFTRPIASKRLGGMLDDRGIGLESDFYVERVDDVTKTLVSYDEREIPFDLLVTVPVNRGAPFVGRSHLGDELDYVTVDPGTLQSTRDESIFAVGDAANLPTSKAGSVAHFAVEILVHNLVDHVAGRRMTRRFDGHANCFVESGGGKAMLLDFNYDTEPLPGRYPLPLVGPFSLLEETTLNHQGKLAFKWVYWNMLLPGRPIPLSSRMSMVGKREEVRA